MNGGYKSDVARSDGTAESEDTAEIEVKCGNSDPSAKKHADSCLPEKKQGIESSDVDYDSTGALTHKKCGSKDDLLGLPKYEIKPSEGKTSKEACGGNTST